MAILSKTDREYRCFAEIDLNVIRNNFKLYRENSLGEIMAVVKANAYGHGDVKIAKCLMELGVRFFAVACIDEAIALRRAGINGEILVLGYTPPTLAAELVGYGITQAIPSEEYAALLSLASGRVKCQFAIDTGMNRIGLNAKNPEHCIRVIRKYSKSLFVNGIFTHLSSADAQDGESARYTESQRRSFYEIANAIRDMRLPYVHYKNSAAGLTYKADDSIIRLGIALYGLKPSVDFSLPEAIRPALSWKAKISMIKTVRAGDFIGYGRAYRAKSDRKIATLSVGYADGYSRLLSDKGYALINGKRAPVVGRVCMDQTMVDVTDVSRVSPFEDATLIGGGISADTLADLTGTINYEVVTSISKRVKRLYIDK